VLESVTQQFVLFLNTGTPVRAKLSVSFKEYNTPTEEERKNPEPTSFPAQTYTVKAGDTLSAIAGALWDDPALWRLLADENTILNPRVLEPGRVLAVPPIE
jgi:nucleoid-associated protein YgaU